MVNLKIPLVGAVTLISLTTPTMAEVPPCNDKEVLSTVIKVFKENLTPTTAMLFVAHHDPARIQIEFIRGRGMNGNIENCAGVLMSPFRMETNPSESPAKLEIDYTVEPILDGDGRFYVHLHWNF
jgi:hypothetical protein